MIRAHSVEAVRRAEAAAMEQLPAGALMQRAAAALAGVVARELRARAGGVYGRRVVLLVGPGSNGGDAMWAGARLAGRGADVLAVLTHPRPHAGGLAGLRAAGGRVVDATAGDGEKCAAGVLAAADLMVDGLLGIGGRPGLDGVAADLVADLDPAVPVVAVDLPSGVAPDTGALRGPHVQAHVTVTFGTAKPCLLLPPGNGAAGDVVLVDIGLDEAELGLPAVERLEPADVAGRWPVPLSADDKYSRGVVGVVAGGSTYTGAAVLCSGGAVRSGAGMVRYIGPPQPTDLVRGKWPEVVPGPGRVQAWVLGPGVDPTDDEQAGAVQLALDSGEPCLVDAGALEVLALALATGRRPRGALLLTPHAGELARLLAALPDAVLSDPALSDVALPERDGSSPYGGLTREQVESEPLRFARAAADATGATVLLKGATTLVVAPDGPTLLQDHGGVRSQVDGPHWLATAGSGDVLAGIAGTLLAAGLEPLEAGSLAVVVHGAAGQLANDGGPVSAGTLLDAVPRTIADLLTGAPGRGTPTA